jgi:osmotically inducible lipoprotein OsmB
MGDYQTEGAALSVAGQIYDDRLFRHRIFNTEVFQMNTIRKLMVNVAAVVLLAGLGGCAGMSQQDKNTAIGAGVGAVGGSVLTGGSAAGTVGGAAVGGIIGHEISK